MNRRNCKQQSKTYKTASKIDRFVVAAAQVEIQRLCCDPSAGRVIENVSNVVINRHSTVACVHGNRCKDVATARWSKAFIVGEIAVVQVDAVTLSHVYGSRELLL